MVCPESENEKINNRKKVSQNFIIVILYNNILINELDKLFESQLENNPDESWSP
jgi:hypothetical protein